MNCAEGSYRGSQLGMILGENTIHFRPLGPLAQSTKAYPTMPGIRNGKNHRGLLRFKNFLDNTTRPHRQMYYQDTINILKLILERSQLGRRTVDHPKTM